MKILLRIVTNTLLVLVTFNLYYFLFMKSHPSPDAIFNAFILPIIIVSHLAIVFNIIMEKIGGFDLGSNMSFLSFTLSLLLGIFVTVITEPASKPFVYVTKGVVIVLEIIIMLIITVIIWLCTHIFSKKK